MPSSRLPLLVALLLFACSDARDAAPLDGGDDSRLDAAPDAAAPGPRLPQPSALPVNAADVLRVGPAIEVDIASALRPDGDGFSVVFESFDEPFEQSRLFRLESPDGRELSPRVEMPADRAFEASPSFVGDDLFFLSTDSREAIPSFVVLRGEGRTVVPAPAGVDWLLSWPKVYPWCDGLALAFRDGRSQPMFASGASLDALAAPVPVGPASGGAMATLGVFGDGSLAFTYQHPVAAEPMVSFVCRSTDGTTWTDPVRVTDASPNVHDTTLVARSDGGLDLYYIYPATPRGFALFRRALGPDGALGPEERVTADDVIEPSKPEGLRLAGGRVLVAYAEISERDADGLPGRQSLVLVSLPSEAEAP